MTLLQKWMTTASVTVALFSSVPVLGATVFGNVKELQGGCAGSALDWGSGYGVGTCGQEFPLGGDDVEIVVIDGEVLATQADGTIDASELQNVKYKVPVESDGTYAVELGAGQYTVLAIVDHIAYGSGFSPSDVFTVIKVDNDDQVKVDFLIDRSIY